MPRRTFVRWNCEVGSNRAPAALRDEEGSGGRGGIAARRREERQGRTYATVAKERERKGEIETESARKRVKAKRDSPRAPCPSSCLLGRREPTGATMASNDVPGDTSHVALRCSLSVHTLRRTTAHYRRIHRRREVREGRRGREKRDGKKENAHVRDRASKIARHAHDHTSSFNMSPLS